MSLENRKSAEKKLLEISEEKGYVTEDDISSTADDYSLSLIDYDWLTDDLYTRNILVKSEEDDSVSLVNPEQYKDYSFVRLIISFLCKDNQLFGFLPLRRNDILDF